MPRESWDSVRVIFLDGEKAIAKLRELAAKVVQENPAVQRVLLFGSLARGDYSPRSDADLIVVLADDSRRMMDRIPEFLEAFSTAPVPVDVLPYTEAELDKMLEDDNFFVKRALREALVLASRQETID